MEGKSGKQLVSQMSQRNHNKSNLSVLSIFELTTEQLDVCRTILSNSIVQQKGFIEKSFCRLMKQKDGRITLKQKKVCYGYELVALDLFGAENLKRVCPNKYQNSLAISHICGTRLCCSSDHLRLETKSINDERTHCHYCIKNIYSKSGYEGLKSFVLLGGCKHNPNCC